TTSADAGGAGGPAGPPTPPRSGVRFPTPREPIFGGDTATADGTAKAPQDYTPVARTTLTFAPGEVEKLVQVQVVGDGVAEPNETFQVNLSNAFNAVIFDAAGVGTIQDGGVSVSINDAAVREGLSGEEQTLPFTVSLSAQSNQRVTVHWRTRDKTATAGSDYKAVTDETLTFNPGEVSKQIGVTVYGDADHEPDEQFEVVLFQVT